MARNMNHPLSGGFCKVSTDTFGKKKKGNKISPACVNDIVEKLQKQIKAVLFPEILY